MYRFTSSLTKLLMGTETEYFSKALVDVDKGIPTSTVGIVCWPLSSSSLYVASSRNIGEALLFLEMFKCLLSGKLCQVYKEKRELHKNMMKRVQQQFN